jgi:hypothetical protein
MNNTHLESFSIEELQQRNEFTALPEVECCGLKCLGSQDDDPIYA